MAAFTKLVLDHPEFARIYLDYAARKLAGENENLDLVRFQQMVRTTMERAFLRLEEEDRALNRQKIGPDAMRVTSQKSNQELRQVVRGHRDYFDINVESLDMADPFADQVINLAGPRGQAVGNFSGSVMEQAPLGIGALALTQTASYSTSGLQRDR